jgi:Zn-dependent protease with chaperone function
MNQGPEVDYFDGVTSTPRAARLSVHDAQLHILAAADGAVLRSVPLRNVRWPERQRHGLRAVHFDTGGMVQCNDSAAWDAFARESGVRESMVVRTQQRWGGTLAALALTVGAIAGVYVWGLPWATRAVVAVVPPSVDEAAGRAALAGLPSNFLKPSQLSLDKQRSIRAAFARALTAAYGAGAVPKHELRFHDSAIGPNAFALPGGTIVLTDAMVKLVGEREDVIVGILAHELGHVEHRHGMHMLVQASALAALSSLVLGDFSGILATVPVALGQAAYSRDAERESDAQTVRILRAAGISPAVMVTLFEALCRLGPDGKPTAPAKPDQPATTGSAETTGCGDGEDGSDRVRTMLSSHPIHAERIAFFRQAAAVNP